MINCSPKPPHDEAIQAIFKSKTIVISEVEGPLLSPHPNVFQGHFILRDIINTHKFMVNMLLSIVSIFTLHLNYFIIFIMSI